MYGVPNGNVCGLLESFPGSLTSLHVKRSAVDGEEGWVVRQSRIEFGAPNEVKSLDTTLGELRWAVYIDITRKNCAGDAGRVVRCTIVRYGDAHKCSSTPQIEGNLTSLHGTCKGVD